MPNETLTTDYEKIEKLRKLIENFKLKFKELKDFGYNEANVRVDFIDKFFETLDWDVRNDEGATQEFREVIREDTVEVAGKPKAPDYSFRIGGKKIFFVEAKKPSIDIKEALDPAYQVRRYGYSAKLPISVLTDFEQLAIYDTRIKPHKNDKAGVARIFYCTFEDYEKNFETIRNVLSKEAIKTGSLNKYLDKAQIKRGVSEVDKEFLELIEDWRKHLAQNLALQNKKITIQSLNYAVQKIIDRIIFLRIGEDKGVENYGNLLALAKEKDIYKALNDYFVKADKKYNSEIFKQEQTLTSLKIDNDTLGDIINSLYYPDCPYELSVLPIDILGSIYECFLGKTIHLTLTHQSRIEDKPEVKKAGGVYYTPQYIVDYIVKNTIGEKIKDKTPKEIAKIKILDPACGSGSFLIGAYSYLLNYHLQYYKSNPENIKKALKENILYQTKNVYLLTIQEKQRILLNNIFGVDIDAQAVEVTKLSLFLKLMEGESQESTGNLFRYSEIKLLPNLSGNIKCGNSLIGPDYYQNKNLSLLDNEEMQKINAFDWEKNFPETLKNGGFDVIIGNPPYVKARDYDKDKTYYRNYLNNNPNYETLYKMWDLYIPFLEKGVKLLKQNGSIGMIVPDTIEKSDYALLLREWLVKKFYVYQIDFFPNSKIFVTQNKVVGITNTIIFVSKSHKLQTVRRFFHSKDYKIIDKGDTVEHNIELFKQNKINLAPIRTKTIPLGEICFTSYGLRLNSDKSNTKNIFKKSDLISDVKTNINIRLFTEGKNLKRYNITKSSWVEWGTNRCPRLLVRPTFPELYEPEKLLLGRQTKVVALDDKKHIVDNTIIVCIPYFKLNGIVNNNINKYFRNLNKPRQTLEDSSRSFSLHYLLGILNSKFIKYYIRFLTQNSIDMFPDDWKHLPIPVIEQYNRVNQEKIISFAQQMLEIQKELHSTKKEEDKTIYQRKIELVDKQIDALVYELYGLNSDEIKTIEDSQKST